MGAAPAPVSPDLAQLGTIVRNCRVIPRILGAESGVMTHKLAYWSPWRANRDEGWIDFYQ